MMPEQKQPVDRELHALLLKYFLPALNYYKQLKIKFKKKSVHTQQFFANTARRPELKL